MRGSEYRAQQMRGLLEAQPTGAIFMGVPGITGTNAAKLSEAELCQIGARVRRYAYNRKA